jgi:3',5'-cyclic AMP phosphodiesterase CpdA
VRTLAHLSDLHFGRTDPAVVEALLADLAGLRPDLAIISGDITQRARTHQFAEAKAFLARLPCPALVVPGNHDLAPLWLPFSRLFTPRARFRRALPGHADWPVWHDDEVVAIGLDSTRHLRWITGKLRRGHLQHVEQVVTASPDEACKVVFLHHPPPSAPSGHPFQTLAENGVDLILTGHVHQAKVTVIAAEGPCSAVLAQASTACSTRLRGDANGYGVIRIAMPVMDITIHGWTGDGFAARRHHRFEKRGNVWAAEGTPRTGV